MAETIGEVEVVLRARIGQLEADLKKAEGKAKTTAKRMSSSFRKVATAVRMVKTNLAAVAALAGGLAGGAFFGLAKAAIRTANDLGDVAQKLGISASALQEFQYAANQSGVATQTLNMGLQRFGRRAAEAAAGTGEARDAIKQLGIQLKDSGGALRSTEELFDEALTKLGEIENPLERVRLGFKLFDSEGVALVNMAGKLGDLREEAQSLGLVLDDEVIARSDELQDSFDALWAVTKGQLTPALVDLGGSAIQSTLETMADLAKWANAVYRSFADIQSLGLSNAQMKLTEQQEALKNATERLAAAEERANTARGIAAGAAAGQAGRIREEIEAKKQAIEATKAHIELLKNEREESKPDAPVDTGPPPTTVAEEKALEDARKRAIEERRKAAKAAHREFLAQSDQRVLLVQEELAEEIAALSTGLEAEEDYAQAIVELRKTAALKIAEIREEDAEKRKKTLDEEQKEYKALFDFMEDGFSDAMATMLLEGEFTFKSLAISFAREFIQLGINKTIMPMVSGALGKIGDFLGILGGGGGGFSPTPIAQLPGPKNVSFGGLLNDTFFPPGRANGGPLSGAAIVGERGPELFIPGRSGFVATNSQLQKMGAGGGSNVNVTIINNSGEETSTTERDGPNGMKEIEVMIGKTVSKSISRGGDVDKAIRNSYGIQRVGRHGL